MVTSAVWLVFAAGLMFGGTPAEPRGEEGRCHAPGHPGESCRDIRGTISTEFSLTACPTTLGCFTGTLRTNSPLRGSTFFVTQSVTQTGTTLSYTGTLYVTLPNGEVETFQSLGTINLLTGEFLETDVAIEGPYGGTLTSAGLVSPALNAFSGTVTGTLCKEPGPPR